MSGEFDFHFYTCSLSQKKKMTLNSHRFSRLHRGSFTLSEEQMVDRVEKTSVGGEDRGTTGIGVYK